MSVESGDCIRGRGPGCCCGRSAARMSEPASHGRTLLARRELQLLLPSLEQNSLYVNSQVLVLSIQYYLLIVCRRCHAWCDKFEETPIVNLGK